MIIDSTPVTTQPHFALEDMLIHIFTFGLKVLLIGTCEIKTCENDEVKAGALVNTNTESITPYEAGKDSSYSLTPQLLGLPKETHHTIIPRERHVASRLKIIPNTFPPAPSCMHFDQRI